MPQRLGADVDAELSRHGPAADTARMLSAWRETVGDAIARNAWPARIGRDGTLHVHTSDSVWAFELGHRAPEIAERLRVPAVRFAPGPLPEAATDASATPGPRLIEPGPAERAEAARITAGVSDAELRELVARAVAAGLARAASDRRF
jgi:hypothetical protein